MGMIRRADLEQVTRSALVMNLGDIGARAQSILADAQAQADRLIAEGRAERERLIATARDEGFRKGYDDGLAKGLDEGRATGSEQARVQATNDLGTLLQGWSAALESFEADRDAMLSAARTEMVELAAEIASRVTRRVIELDPGVVNAQMEAVLLAVARPSKLLVRVNPADLQRAAADLPGLLERFERCRHADLIGDATLEPGSCAATTEDGGRIDAAIDTQLARILAELLPADTSASSTRQPRIDAA